MAKQTAKQRTVKRPSKPAAPSGRGATSKKPASKPAPKSTRAAKPASKPKAVARGKSTPVKRPAAAVARSLKPVAKRSALLTKPAPTKPTKPVPSATTPAKGTPLAKRAAAIAKAPPSPAKPNGAVVAKVASANGLVPVDKPSPAATKPSTLAKPAPAVAPKPGATVKPAIAAKPSTNGTPTPIVEPKPTGRPMLSQGPFVGSTLTKRGTFAPDKLAAPAPKLPRKRPEPIAPAAPIAPKPPAIATGDKAAKNRAGLNQRDLDFFRDLLLAKRRELLGDMSSMEREALREGSSDLSTLPIHMADQGTDAYEQEFTLGLVEKDRTLLRELNNALAKIQNGSYGICEATGLPISKPRLEAQPWAKYSIEHARAMEKKQMMFRR